jgi:hypothetical protein
VARRRRIARLTEKQVLDHGQIGHRPKCWCTIATPARSALAGPEREGRPRIAGVGAANAEDDVAKRRLSGAVLAEQAVDLAGGDRERDVGEAASALKRC